LISRRLILEEGRDKRPLTDKRSRYEIRSYYEISEIYQRNNEVRLENNPNATRPGVVVYDFDLYKYTNSETHKHLFTSLLNYIVINNITAILSSSGGLHLYFTLTKSEVFKKKSVDRFLACLIGHVDILSTGGVVGPGPGRVIINLGEN
jgi:hypothetical protein